VKEDYLSRLENELQGLKGSRCQTFSSDDVGTARKLYVDMISGRSNRTQSDFRIAMTVLICGILIGVGGLVLASLAAIVFGSITAIIGAGFVFTLYGNKAQIDKLTKANRLDALKRIYAWELISSQEYHDAVNFVTNAPESTGD
jgi:hypothetical protein